MFFWAISILTYDPNNFEDHLKNEISWRFSNWIWKFCLIFFEEEKLALDSYVNLYEKVWKSGSHLALETLHSLLFMKNYSLHRTKNNTAFCSCFSNIKQRTVPNTQPCFLSGKKRKSYANHRKVWITEENVNNNFSKSVSFTKNVKFTVR